MFQPKPNFDPNFNADFKVRAPAQPQFADAQPEISLLARLCHVDLGLT